MASRRWIDLAMLTPGVSQDNIRGFFYRGNVNVGAGTREYSNGFVVDGVNNTWAQMGEPRQNFAMDSIREFKVSTVHLQGRIRPRHGRPADGRHEVGHQRVARLGLPFFRDKALTARDRLRGGATGLPPLAVRRHVRRSDRARTARISSCAVECTDENQFFTVNAGGRFPQYDGTFPSDQYRWTYSAKVDHQISPTQSLFVPRRAGSTSTGRSSPPAAACIRPTASTSRCRAIRTSPATPGS